jgi:hypothetical protein
VCVAAHKGLTGHVGISHVALSGARRHSVAISVRNLEIMEENTRTPLFDTVPAHAVYLAREETKRVESRELAKREEEATKREREATKRVMIERGHDIEYIQRVLDM